MEVMRIMRRKRKGKTKQINKNKQTKHILGRTPLILAGDFYLSVFCWVALQLAEPAQLLQPCWPAKDSHGFVGGMSPMYSISDSDR
jgi:hypothetical protein